MKKPHSALFYYLILFFVIFVWGLDPAVYSFLYQYYSASVLCAVSSFVSFLFFLLLSFKRLRQLNKDYIRIAVPIGALNAVASLLQRIGLQYTTPAKYAFLEHLSCVAVPAALFLLTKKKPSRLQLFFCFLCLAGCFVLNCEGAKFQVYSGDLLCALSGILYGVAIAAIGVYAVKLDSRLYMTVYMLVYFLISVVSSVLLNRICVGGAPLEPAVFTANAGILAGAALFGLISVGITWLLRSKAIMHLSPTTVGIFSPLAAIIAASVSVITGADSLTWNLCVGAILIAAASALCAVNDIRVQKYRRIRKTSHNKGL